MWTLESKVDAVYAEHVEARLIRSKLIDADKGRILRETEPIPRSIPMPESYYLKLTFLGTTLWQVKRYLYLFLWALYPYRITCLESSTAELMTTNR